MRPAFLFFLPHHHRSTSFLRLRPYRTHSFLFLISSLCLASSAISSSVAFAKSPGPASASQLAAFSIAVPCSRSSPYAFAIAITLRTSLRDPVLPFPFPFPLPLPSFLWRWRLAFGVGVRSLAFGVPVSDLRFDFRRLGCGFRSALYLHGYILMGNMVMVRLLPSW